MLFRSLGISSIGSGKFELKDENLNLIFDYNEPVSGSEIEITESKAESEKEIKLKFIIRDETGFEIPANVLRTTDRKHFFFDEVNKIFNVDKNSPKAKYSIQFIGYETVDLEINNKTDKVINIRLLPKRIRVVSEEELVFKWNKINNTEFKTGSNLWDRFKKVE